MTVKLALARAKLTPLGPARTLLKAVVKTVALPRVAARAPVAKQLVASTVAALGALLALAAQEVKAAAAAQEMVQEAPLVLAMQEVAAAMAALGAPLAPATREVAAAVMVQEAPLVLALPTSALQELAMGQITPPAMAVGTALVAGLAARAAAERLAARAAAETDKGTTTP